MNRTLITILILLVGSMMVQAQEIIPPVEEALSLDSVQVSIGDSVSVQDTIPARPNALEAPVNYQAADSIVMTSGNWAYLFGEGKVNYQFIELEAENIEINMDSSLVYATFGLDSVGMEFGYPLFKEGEQAYESKSMRYNFKTEKGYISEVLTEQGEGYVTARRTKKMPDNILNMDGGRYSTCDNHDHPHFYIQMTKAKVRPHKNIVTGPVYLVIEDVPLPLALPFAFFPFSSSYSSGIIMPSYGDDSRYGYNLREGGYYFAISDYMDLAVTGDIYSKGSWGLAAQSSYRKRYKYSGSFKASYQVMIEGDKGLPDYLKSNSMKLQWTHTQDAKANPFRTMSASVNYSTSGYDRKKPVGGVSYAEATENTKGSTINITQRFPNSPFSLSGTMSVNQRTKDSSISMTLPDITLTMSRIYPFKRKNAVGKERWYEKISMSYTGYFRNSIDTKDSLLFKSNLVKDWKNAMQHTIPISATFNVLKYINLSPSINYKERWYTSKIEQRYDTQKQSLTPSDTTYGFYRVYDFSASISASTTLFGMYTPIPALQKLIGVKAIRHRFEPSISFSTQPDFSDPRYGFYEKYYYTDANGNEREEIYSPFRHNQFGVPSSGKSGNVNFSIDNNIEAKVVSKNDSIGEKKISLIDKLSASMSYNMAADSFQWSDLTVNLRLKITKSYTLNLSGAFDTYTYRAVMDKTDPEKVISLQRQNVMRINSGKGLGRLRSTGTSFSYTFNNDTFKKWFGKKDGTTGTQDSSASMDGSMGMDDDMDDHLDHGHDTQQTGGRLMGGKREVGEYDDDGYMVSNIPWSLSFSYSMRLGYNTSDLSKVKKDNPEYKYNITHSLSFNGNIQPTKNWRFNFNATYDFDRKKISYMTCNISRDLHCFQMSASFVPIGPLKSYSFNIAVSSALLKDLKYQQSNNRSGHRWY